MKLTLQQEEEDLYYTDIKAHDASGRRENEEIASSEISYHGEPIKMLYLPKAFTPEGYERVRYAGETMWRILEKVIREYLTHEDYRKLFGFTPELEEMILNAPHYSCLLPICRLDMFLDEETGDFGFCEFNADGSSAMNENRVMTLAYQKSLIARELDEKYDQRYFELFDSWAELFLTLCRETGDTPDHPNVAVVDFMENSINPTEFERFAEAFRRAGCQAQVAEIRDLTYDGSHLYAKDGMRIDAIYRRAVTSDVLDHRAEIGPFLAAVRDKRVCLIGDFCTQVVHDKILFRILHMVRTREFLTPEETAFVEAHVPYTAMLDEMHASWADVRERKHLWIIKPEDSYGAHGIFFSANHTLERWQEILEECQGRGYVLQRYIIPYRTLNADYSDTDYTANRWQKQAEGQKSPYIHSFANMTGMYLYGGKLTGVYSRLSPKNIISVEGDEHEMVSLVAEPKANRAAFGE